MEWYCMECQAFLPVDKFKPGPKRWVCKRHCNERWNKAKLERWREKPGEKRSSITWQIAYRDSLSVFFSKIDITPAQVKRLLLQDEDIVNASPRLLPFNPTKPLAMENYLFVSSEIRKVMCRVWKQSRCIHKYNEALRHYQME